MIENAGQVKIVEEVTVLSHVFGVMLGDEFELVEEFPSAHNLHLALELTDNVLEFVV